jgi:hypothetical protein
MGRTDVAICYMRMMRNSSFTPNGFADGLHPHLPVRRMQAKILPSEQGDYKEGES